MTPYLLPRAAAGLCITACCTSALAGDVYVKAGLNGGIVGYAQPLSTSFGLRVDLASVGEVQEQRSNNGIQYDAKLKLNRAALLADWFPLESGFRITAGVTSNQYQLDLQASGAGGTLTIGGTTYTTSAADGLLVNVRFPTTSPYLGLGWGHQVSKGLRFSADLGAMVGRATLTSAVSGPLAQRVSQADLDAELASWRNTVARVRAFPQLSLGLGYSF
jgi:hypothetical protein